MQSQKIEIIGLLTILLIIFGLFFAFGKDHISPPNPLVPVVPASTDPIINKYQSLIKTHCFTSDNWEEMIEIPCKG